MWRWPNHFSVLTCSNSMFLSLSAVMEEVTGCSSEVEVFSRSSTETMSRRDSVSVRCSPSQNLQMSTPRSQPLTIRNTHSFRPKGEFRACSAPLIPNPFPELCSPTHSPVLTGSLGRSDPPSGSSTHVVQVFGDSTHSRSVLVSSGATARDVCHILAQAAHCTDEENWALIEHHSALGLERCLEDHELVVQVQSSWPVEGDTKLIFRKNYAKYEFFKKPVLFFPEHMISDSADVTKGMKSSELVQNMVKSGSCPEIQGYLHVREGGKKSWKKLYFFLRRSGLYCSNKGQSKEPRHLQFIADLEDLNVFAVFNGRKLYGAPGEHVFCVKASKVRFRTQDLKLMCADTEQIRTCWITAFRLFKHGKQLQCNFHLAQSGSRLPKPSQQESKFTDREESMVAMDFSGKSGGRVIQNPHEAQNAEQEEGHNWRKKEAIRYNLINRSHGLQLSSVHRVQPWFHGGVSRNEAQRLLEEQGQVDGMFLIRDSQLHAQCFVLSMCYKLETKHYLIISVERQYYTMDDGVTLFTDLLQLVEFYQINRGILPVCLKHPCTCIAL
ncbi:growth factor receptor-bound protein 7-like isoform X1 [Xyrauchen texanus]|uniref:growth factor receptor-bound protein 7-like isoform X1 n=2 Tax=Xyrauchen texanus TaxID=154827 RepID=UPI002241FD99|nr:growth factor receptor-bound protein 7-like isoform X1 [Xyrauchen texanus]